MDRERLRLLGENIKALLLSKKSREVSLFCFFLLVSAGFWLLQTLHEEYEMELQIPFSLKNVPTGAVITSDLPSELSVTVRDRGTSLLNYYFNGDQRVLEIDFQTHDRGASFEHVLLTHSEVQKSLRALLLPSSHIVSIRPDTLDYYYTRGVQKRLPVVIRGRIEAAPLSYLRSVKVEPDSVTVWGNEQLLDSLKNMNTVVINLTDLKETTVQQVPIAVLRGTKAIPSEVTLTADVDVYTEKQVKVPIVGTNFPAGYSLRTFPSSVTISFRVGTKDYKNITEENFVLTTTYEELMEMPDSILTLQLRSVPEGVSRVKIEPQAVQYLIEQTETNE